MYRDIFQSTKYSYWAVIVAVLGGALLLWLVLRFAFSVTSGLIQATPPLQ